MARVYFLRPEEFSYSLLGLDSFPPFYPQCFQSCELSLSVPLCEDCGLHNFLGAIFLFWGRPLGSCDKVTFAVFPVHRASQSHGSRVCIPTASCVFHAPHSIPSSLRPIPFLSLPPFIFVHQHPLSRTYFYQVSSVFLDACDLNHGSTVCNH